MGGGGRFIPQDRLGWVAEHPEILCHPAAGSFPLSPNPHSILMKEVTYMHGQFEDKGKDQVTSETPKGIEGFRGNRCQAYTLIILCMGRAGLAPCCVVIGPS